MGKSLSALAELGLYAIGLKHPLRLKRFSSFQDDPAPMGRPPKTQELQWLVFLLVLSVE